jgi:hypothetical protein
MGRMRTVTISRSRGNQCSDPFEDITVQVEGPTSELLRDDLFEDWVVTLALDESSDEVVLTETENLLARCLAAAGVDETGR